MSMINLNPLSSLLTLLSLPTIIHLCYLSQITYSKLNSKAEGLVLKMTHINSPSSPLYQPKFTTKGNVSRYYKPNMWANVKAQEGVYYVEIGIGEFNDKPPHTNYLIFDTGSDDTWTQCADCSKCFDQMFSRFPSKDSKTYSGVPCTQPECGGQCNQWQHCTKTNVYGDGTEVRGVFATETFTLGRDTYNELRFLCAYYTKDFTSVEGNGNIVTGILGMDRRENSFISQLGNRAQYQFSFCLQHPNHASEMYLSFGSYVTRTPDMSVTKIVGDAQYHVELYDISVGETRLHIPPELFALRSDRSGGTIIDTGTLVSRIVSSAFDMLVQEVATYITANNQYLKWANQDPGGFEACWETYYGNAPVYFPSLTFHFQDGADMRVEHSEVIIKSRDEDLYCLAMLKHDENIIGSYQLVNQKVIIDIRTNQFFFNSADCSQSQ